MVSKSLAKEIEMKRSFAIVFAIVFLMLSVSIVSADSTALYPDQVSAADATQTDPAVAKMQKQRAAMKVQRESLKKADDELKTLESDYKQKRGTLTGEAKQDADYDYRTKRATLNKQKFYSAQCLDATSRGLQCSNRK
jgi:hypothetical protein